MKTTPQCKAVVAAWLLPAFMAMGSGFAQGTDEPSAGPAREARARGSDKFLAEAPSDEVRLERELVRAEAPASEKFLFRASDRAQRGRVQPVQLRTLGGLPALSAGVPEESSDLSLESQESPRAGS